MLPHFLFLRSNIVVYQSFEIYAKVIDHIIEKGFQDFLEYHAVYAY